MRQITQGHPKLVFIKGFPHWEASDGFVVPAVMGGDNGGTGSNVDGGQGSGSDSSEHSLRNEFLNNVADDDKAIVEKYINDWDSQVTQRFQKIHDEYSPYKELDADVDDIKGALNIKTLIDSQPQVVFGLLAQHLGVDVNQLTGGSGDDELDDPNDQQPNGEVQLPKEFMQQFEQQQQLIENLAQIVLGNQQQSQLQKQQEEFDNLLDSLEEKHGGFDRDYVTIRISQGMAPEEAISDFRSALEKFGGTKETPPPPILSGAGSAPSGGKGLKDLSSQEQDDLVVKILEQANQS